MSEEIVSIVLASASPRRRELLAKMGLDFEVVPAEIEETRLPQESPESLARRLSEAKARAVAPMHPLALVLAADTLVVVDQQVLGKPASRAEAQQMLVRLRNRRHMVYSGLTILDAARDRCCSQVAATLVIMRDYGDGEIRCYVESDDPLDKAGAYAIQDSGFSPVERIESCYANVMGLPMCHLHRALSAWHIGVCVHPLDCCPFAVSQGCPWARDILGAPPDRW